MLDGSRRLAREAEVSVRRLLRLLGWHRNEMRRGTDRIEAWLTAWLLLVLIVAGLWVGNWAACVTYRSEVRQRESEREHRHQVSAVLLENPATPAATGDDGLPVGRPVARATWTAPDGSTHSGSIDVDPAERAGQRITLWVDDRGLPSLPPPGASPRLDAALAAIAAVLCLILALGVTRWAVGLVLERRRLRSWQREWSEVEPRWSRHR